MKAGLNKQRKRGRSVENLISLPGDYDAGSDVTLANEFSCGALIVNNLSK